MSMNRRGFVTGVAAAAAGARALLSEATETTMNRDTVVELRQYTLRKNGRDTLIRMFEDHFIEPQNALGAHIVGTFRDLDDPDRFVWIRSFQDMDVRQRSLGAFYGGPGWKPYRNDANATMLDSDNVLLLRPTTDSRGFEPGGETAGSNHVISAWIYYLDKTPPEDFAAYFQKSIAPRIAAMDVRPIAQLMSASEANNFPALPIRENDRVYVWLARWNSLKEEEQFALRWSTLSGWRDDAPEAIFPALARKPERLRLSPTARSALR